MSKKECKLAEKIIEEVSENPKDKSRFIVFFGVAMIIAAVGFSIVVAAMTGRFVIKYFVNNDEQTFSTRNSSVWDNNRSDMVN